MLLCRRHHVLWHLGTLDPQDLHIPWHPDAKAPDRRQRDPGVNGPTGAVLPTARTRGEQDVGMHRRRRLLLGSGACLCALGAAAGCGGSGSERLAEPDRPAASGPAVAPLPGLEPGGPVRAPAPPAPEDIGPDGDLLPGTAVYLERERARAQSEALQARGLAEARALAPQADAFARGDPRTAELLAGATYDPAGAEPIGDGTRVLGVVLTSSLPEPRDFFYEYASLDGPQPEDVVAAVHTFGATQVAVSVDLDRRHLRGLRVLASADTITYDAQGNELLSSFDPPD